MSPSSYPSSLSSMLSPHFQMQTSIMTLWTKVLQWHPTTTTSLLARRFHCMYANPLRHVYLTSDHFLRFIPHHLPINTHYLPFSRYDTHFLSLHFSWDCFPTLPTDEYLTIFNTQPKQHFLWHFPWCLHPLRYESINPSLVSPLFGGPFVEILSNLQNQS